MKIRYYTVISSKEEAERLYFKVASALTNSRLPFVCDIEDSQTTYNITVELSTESNPFDSWDEMENYIRKFVIAQNKEAHVLTGLLKLEERLYELTPKG